MLDKIEQDLTIRPEACPALKGQFAGLRKLRVGSDRVIFAILEQQVLVPRTGHRRNVSERSGGVSVATRPDDLSSGTRCTSSWFHQRTFRGTAPLARISSEAAISWGYPDPQRTSVDIEKVREYCLHADHPRGRTARVFAAALGLTAGDAELLRDALLDTAQTVRRRSGRRRWFRPPLRGQIYDGRAEGGRGSAALRPASRRELRAVCHLLRRSGDGPVGKPQPFTFWTSWRWSKTWPIAAFGTARWGQSWSGWTTGSSKWNSPTTEAHVLHARPPRKPSIVLHYQPVQVA